MGAVVALVPEYGDGDGGGEATLFACELCGGIVFKVYDDLTGECVQCEGEVSFADDQDTT